MNTQCPIVLVHGILGYGSRELLGFSYWGQALQAPSPVPVLEASVGPLSSHHDRACELYAQIKGLPVDYGQEHAASAGHSRFGKDYTGRGLYPQWSAENPIHLVGHSMGGPTIRMLQHLLDRQFWREDSSASWIKSVTGISGVFNGSTLTHMFCDAKTGKVTKPLGTMLSKVVNFAAGITGSKLDRLYDFDLEQWGLTRESGESLAGYLARIDQSRLFREIDNAVYDLTIHAALELNTLIPTFPGTYYFSFVTENTSALPLLRLHGPGTDISGLFLASSAYMGMYPFFPKFYEGFNSDDWRENDGAVSSYSQMYPRLSGRHPVGGDMDADEGGFQPGKWYWKYLHDRDHLNVVMLPKPFQADWQKAFYADLFDMLAGL
ncbi:MAG: esterase/lipase family protein [Gammaproteobacteria bacterium]